MSAFEELHEIRPQTLAEGHLARAVHGERLMLPVVEIEPGAELPQHLHANEQFGMVLQGVVIFRVGDKERTVGPGGIWRIRSETPLSMTAGTAGRSSSTSFLHLATIGSGRSGWGGKNQRGP